MQHRQDTHPFTEVREAAHLLVVAPVSSNTRPFEDKDGTLAFGVPDSCRLDAHSLDDLCEAVLNRAERIARARTQLAEAVWQFSYTLRLTPKDCDQAVGDLQPLSASIFQFCLLVERAASLPLVIIPLRYPLIVALYNTNEQIRQLRLRIGHCHDACHRTSKLVARHQQEIQRKSEVLLRSTDEIVRLSEILVDRAYNQEYIAATIR